MHELRNFLNGVITAKRNLKEVYYTSKHPDTKSDAKELVAATIQLEKAVERLIDLKQTSKVAKEVLNDRRAEINLRKWSESFPKRAEAYAKKKRDLRHEHLHKYQETLMDYIQSLNDMLAAWLADIETISGIPDMPDE